MAIVLPIQPTGSTFRFRTTIEGVTYGFEFSWNHRTEAWYVTFLDGEGNVLRAGVMVRLGLPLFGRNLFPPGLPPGIWSAVDTSGANKEATYSDLGSRVVVMFTPLAEVSA